MQAVKTLLFMPYKNNKRVKGFKKANILTFYQNLLYSKIYMIIYLNFSIIYEQGVIS